MTRTAARLASGLARGARPHVWPAALGLGLGLLALGPALGPGYVLTYDMVFVPDPPITAGLTGGPPRAFPSDLVVALAAKIIPADSVQKLILIAIFVLACAGAAALLAAGWTRAAGSPPHLVARLAAGACYAWNPFVAERLIMGQWAMLLGYAGLPWLLREIGGALGARLPLRAGIAALPAAIGGFAAMSITAVAALPAALLADEAWPARMRRVAVTIAVLGALSLPWIIPSLVAGVHTDPGGATAFAARADTPFGTAGSLLMLGGIWNAEAVPAGYGGYASAAWLAVALLALAGYVAAARPRRICPGLGVAAALGSILAALSLLAPALSVLQSAIAAWPGFALLRDSQQFIAPLALAESIGLGAGAAALTSAVRRVASAPEPGSPDDSSHPGGGKADGSKAGGRKASGRKAAPGPAVAIGVLAMIAPVVLLPGLAWGAVGRLSAVQYPADWLRARQFIGADGRPGSVLLLPWAQYRRYPWNRGEAVFDPWPRLLPRPMIWNDALRVGTTTVAAEGSQARKLGPVVESGRPLTGPLLAAGVRYVIVDAGPLLGQARSRLPLLARLPGARVELASPDLIVFLLPAGSARHQ
jgi:hypothetical protein